MPHPTEPSIQAIAEALRDHQLRAHIRHIEGAPDQDYKCRCGDLFWSIPDWAHHIAEVVAR